MKLSGLVAENFVSLSSFLPSLSRVYFNSGWKNVLWNTLIVFKLFRLNTRPFFPLSIQKVFEYFTKSFSYIRVSFPNSLFPSCPELREKPSQILLTSSSKEFFNKSLSTFLLSFSIFKEENALKKARIKLSFWFLFVFISTIFYNTKKLLVCLASASLCCAVPYQFFFKILILPSKMNSFLPVKYIPIEIPPLNFCPDKKCGDNWQEMKSVPEKGIRIFVDF